MSEFIEPTPRRMSQLYLEKKNEQQQQQQEEHLTELATDINSILRRRRRENDDGKEVPFEYLWKVFYRKFLPQERNHIGIYLSLKKGQPKRWLGLNDPPVFYMFSEITLQPYQKVIPGYTTEERWNLFTSGDEQQYTFQQVFQTLLECGYIKLVSFHDDGAYIDESVEHGVEQYMRKNPNFTSEEVDKTLACKKKTARLVAVFVQEIYKIHAVEHVQQAWIFTPEFQETGFKFDCLEKKNTAGAE